MGCLCLFTTKILLFCVFLQDTWVGDEDDDPRFPLAMWNKYNAILNDIGMTNNAVEGMIIAHFIPNHSYSYHNVNLCK